MLKQKKSLIITAVIVAVLMAVAFVSRMSYEDLPNAMLQSVMCLTRDTIHISLLALWVLSLRHRLVNKNVRKIMLIVGYLMVFWLIDKIVKWDFTGSVTHLCVICGMVFTWGCFLFLPWEHSSSIT